MNIGISNTLNFQKNTTDNIHTLNDYQHCKKLQTLQTKPNLILLEEDQTILMQTTSPEVVSV